MAFSIYIDCENQEEIDRLWQQVTAKREKNGRVAGWKINLRSVGKQAILN